MPPRPPLPLDTLAAIAEIEAKVKKIVAGCDSGWVNPFSLFDQDIPKITQIMQAGAVDAFSERMRYLVDQPGCCRPWLEMAARETAIAVLDCIPFKLKQSSAYKTNFGAIFAELLKTLSPIIGHALHDQSLNPDPAVQQSDQTHDQPNSDIASQRVSTQKTEGLDSKRQIRQPAAVSLPPDETGRFQKGARGESGESPASALPNYEPTPSDSLKKKAVSKRSVAVEAAPPPPGVESRCRYSLMDLTTTEGRGNALAHYTKSWNCSEASLARTARVDPADLSKWKKGQLHPSTSGKKSRIEEALRDNQSPRPPLDRLKN